jgi:hypothetical protein
VAAGYGQAMPPRSGLLGPLQRAVLTALAEATEAMTIRDLATVTGRTHPSGERSLRACVDGLERQGLVSVQRRVVLAFESDGPRTRRRARPEEAEAGAPEFVEEHLSRPILGTLITATVEGRHRIGG